jgi:ubiquitin carboxyl-terminal hydrolase 14
MPTFTVKVKWQKETFKDVQVDTENDIIDFKAQLYALSSVPIERQKIMCAGKTLKDDEWNIPLKNVKTQKIAKSLGHFSLCFFVFREL